MAAKFFPILNILLHDFVDFPTPFSEAKMVQLKTTRYLSHNPSAYRHTHGNHSLLEVYFAGQHRLLKSSLVIDMSYMFKSVALYALWDKISNECQRLKSLELPRDYEIGMLERGRDP